MSTLPAFHPADYVQEQKEVNGTIIRYRAWRNLEYCSCPKDAIQKLNLFVPEDYYTGTPTSGYTLKTAPIMMPNSVGGYMPGPAGDPGADMEGHPNFIFEALRHGYVVAAPGVRGRSTGRKCQDFFVGGTVNQPNTEDGELCGKAPACIVDMKAAVRWLRAGGDSIPGDTDRIFTDGTSAGGALSALVGATGNHPDYEPFLEEIGAAKERDDIFGAVCFCPIIDLEHADAGYEWQFRGIRDAHFMKFSFDDRGQIHIEPSIISMTDQQMEWSDELSSSFPSYVNSLDLRDGKGEKLMLDANGNGSFKEYIIRKLIASAQNEVGANPTTAQRLGWSMCDYTDVKELPYLTFDGETVTALDWDGYIQGITRMKETPAFDQPDLRSPENDEFGTPGEPAKHFTAFGCAHSTANGTLADEKLIRMMNPVEYAADPDVVQAPHWWIRHGSNDRDTSLAMSAILSLRLGGRGLDVNHEYPWGLPHSGDYDLPQLFAWIDALCRD